MAASETRGTAEHGSHVWNQEESPVAPPGSDHDAGELVRCTESLPLADPELPLDLDDVRVIQERVTDPTRPLEEFLGEEDL